MNANSATKPSMMPVKNLAKNGPVGVLKARCTTSGVRTRRWATGRPTRPMLSKSSRRIWRPEPAGTHLSKAANLSQGPAPALEDRHGIIAFGDKQKLVGVSHTVFRNGGAWSYFICPRCGGRKKKLWLIEDAPRCLSCCWSLGVRYRSAYGFGGSERLRERDRYVDRVTIARAQTSAHDDDAPQHDYLPALSARSSTESQ
jgi:hypothetical protein